MTEHRTEPDPPRDPATGSPATVPPAGTGVEPTVGTGALPSQDDGEQSRGRQAADHAGDEGRALAGSARDRGAEVAQSAKDQGSVVAEEAKTQARSVADRAVSELRGQADEQAQRLSGSLATVADQVRALADGRPEDSGQLGGYANDVADRVGDIADRIDTLGFDGVVREVGDFARRRPGAFLAGAAVAGLLTGRFLRNAGGGSSDGDSGGQLPSSTSRRGQHLAEPASSGMHLGPEGGRGVTDDDGAIPPLPPEAPGGTGTVPGSRP